MFFARPSPERRLASKQGSMQFQDFLGITRKTWGYPSNSSLAALKKWQAML